MARILNGIGRSFLAISLVSALAACVTVDQRNNAQIECGVYAVMADGKPLGTAFVVVESGRSYILSAAHVLRGVDPDRVVLKRNCGLDALRVKGVLNLPGLDAVVLIPDGNSLLSGFDLSQTNPSWGEVTIVPNYADIARGSVRLSGKLIPSTGKVIGTDEHVLLLTLDVLNKGSSGAPVLNQHSQVIGLLTNRVLVDGTYSSVSLGIESRSIRQAIRALPPPGNK